MPLVDFRYARRAVVFLLLVGALAAAVLLLSAAGGAEAEASPNTRALDVGCRSHMTVTASSDWGTPRASGDCDGRELSPCSFVTF